MRKRHDRYYADEDSGLTRVRSYLWGNEEGKAGGEERAPAMHYFQDTRMQVRYMSVLRAASAKPNDGTLLWLLLDSSRLLLYVAWYGTAGVLQLWLSASAQLVVKLVCLVVQAVGVDNSTKLSAFLAVGALSPRMVYEEVERHVCTLLQMNCCSHVSGACAEARDQTICTCNFPVHMCLLNQYTKHSALTQSIASYEQFKRYVQAQAAR